MKIYTMPRRLAEQMDFDERCAVVSITDPPPDGGPARIPKRWCIDEVLRLAFHDIDPADWPTIHSINGKPIAEAVMQQSDADRAAQFIHRHATGGTPILVIHCEAGVSRSVSMALAVRAKYPNSSYAPPNVSDVPNKHVFRLMRDALERVT